jgi:hypothetical protein
MLKESVMAKKCVCGTDIHNDRSLCRECGSVYGYNSSEWPEWLRWQVSDIQRENIDEFYHTHLGIDDIEPNGHGGYRAKREFALRGCRTETHLYEERDNF